MPTTFGGEPKKKSFKS
ncbi:hypothetical protein [Staphylococcus aureus]